MNVRTMTAACALVLLLGPVAARAQVGIHIDLGLPAAPPLVEVQPGVQVVEGAPDEIFFSDGWYWCRRGDAWYRARSPRERFYWVEPDRVPAALVQVPEGRYRNWHREEAREHGRDHDRWRHEREERQERHEEHEEHEHGGYGRPDRD